jgi:hypothetical protein
VGVAHAAGGRGKKVASKKVRILAGGSNDDNNTPVWYVVWEGLLEESKAVMNSIRSNSLYPKQLKLVVVEEIKGDLGVSSIHPWEQQ